MGLGVTAHGKGRIICQQVVDQGAQVLTCGVLAAIPGKGRAGEPGLGPWAAPVFGDWSE